jgi:predicted transcriptional regulator
MPKRVLKSATVTARMAPTLEKKLENYANSRGQTKSKAVEGILEQYLDYDNWAIQGIRKAIVSADRGELIPHDEAVRRIQATIAKRKRERRKAA